MAGQPNQNVLRDSTSKGLDTRLNKTFSRSYKASDRSLSREILNEQNPDRGNHEKFSAKTMFDGGKPLNSDDRCCVCGKERKNRIKIHTIHTIHTINQSRIFFYAHSKLSLKLT